MTIPTFYPTTILQMPCPNFWVGRGGYRARYIINHATAGGTSAAAIATYFNSTASTSNPVSSHFIIGTDGKIVQCVSLADSAWGNGVFSAGHDSWWDESVNPNLLTISIEHCKPDLRNASALTPAQEASSFALNRWLCQTNDIPMHIADSTGGITGHFSIDPVNRSQCPGLYNWDALWSYLASATTQEVPTVLNLSQVTGYFTQGQDATQWHCVQHDVIMGGDILTFYRSFGQVGLNGFTIFGLPLQGEVAIPGKGRARLQRCERGIILYDPDHVVDSAPGLSGPCYPAHIDTWGALLGFPVLASGLSQAAVTDAMKQEQALLTDTAAITKDTTMAQTAIDALKTDLKGD